MGPVLAYDETLISAWNYPTREGENMLCRLLLLQDSGKSTVKHANQGLHYCRPHGPRREKSG